MQIRQAVPEDAEGIARVHMSSWRTTYPGIVSAAVLERLSIKRSQEYWLKGIASPENKSFVLVAEDQRLVWLVLRLLAQNDRVTSLTKASYMPSICSRLTRDGALGAAWCRQLPTSC